MPDQRKNLAYTLVLVAPTPAASGTTLDVTAGTATRFPAVPFNATIWPALAVPHAGNAEIVRVTNITGDTLTITRAQEGTSARTILVGDQIANTVTDLTFADLESAVSVVSQALSVETAARVAGDNSLSQAVSVVSNAASHALSVGALAMSLLTTDVSAARVSLAQAVSVVSQQVSVLSQQVSALSQAHSVLSQAHSALSNIVSNHTSQLVSVNDRISAISGNVTSLQSTVSNMRSAVSNVSATSAGGGSATGLQAVIDALSNKISSTGAGAGSVTSNELSTLTSALNALSNLVSDSLSIGGVVSANVTSLQSTVSALRSAVSNVSATSAGGGSATGLQAVIDALSNKISAGGGGGGSVTSNELSTLTSAHNALSNVVSNALSAGDVFSNAFSALKSAVCAVSATSAGGGSATGLQAVVDALSNKISATAAGGQSVTSAEYVSTLSVVSHLRSAVSNVSAQSAGGSATGLQAVIDLLSNKISAGGGAGSVTSNEASAISAQAASAISQLASVVSQGFSVLSQAISVVSQAASAAEAHASTASAAATSVDARVNALSQVVSVLSNVVSNHTSQMVSINDRISVASALASAADAHASVASAAVTSVDARVTSVQSAVSALQSAVSNVSATSLGGGSATGLQAVINALSNKISGTAAGAQSVTSAEYVSTLSVVSHLQSVVSNALSAGDVVSNKISALSALVVSGLASAETLRSSLSAAFTELHTKVSAHLGSVNSAQRANWVSAAQTICAATITNISGTTVSISAGGIYELHGAIVYSVSTTTGHGFGLTFAACSVAGYRIHGEGTVNQTGASTFSVYVTGQGDETDSGSILWSIAAPVQAGRHLISIEGVFQCSATGTIIAGARGSVATNAVTIHRGTFMRVLRLN